MSHINKKKLKGGQRKRKREGEKGWTFYYIYRIRCSNITSIKHVRICEGLFILERKSLKIEEKSKKETFPFLLVSYIPSLI